MAFDRSPLPKGTRPVTAPHNQPHSTPVSKCTVPESDPGDFTSTLPSLSREEGKGEAPGPPNQLHYGPVRTHSVHCCQRTEVRLKTEAQGRKDRAEAAELH